MGARLHRSADNHGELEARFELVAAGARPGITIGVGPAGRVQCAWLSILQRLPAAPGLPLGVKSLLPTKRAAPDPDLAEAFASTRSAVPGRESVRASRESAWPPSGGGTVVPERFDERDGKPDGGDRGPVEWGTRHQYAGGAGPGDWHEARERKRNRGKPGTTPLAEARSRDCLNQCHRARRGARNQTTSPIAADEDWQSAEVMKRERRWLTRGTVLSHVPDARTPHPTLS